MIETFNTFIEALRLPPKGTVSRIYFNNGKSASIQAGDDYRSDSHLDGWETFEISTNTSFELLKPYFGFALPNALHALDTIAGYVPFKIVEKMIVENGGINFKETEDRYQINRRVGLRLVRNSLSNFLEK